MLQGTQESRLPATLILTPSPDFPATAGENPSVRAPSPLSYQSHPLGLTLLPAQNQDVQGLLAYWVPQLGWNPGSLLLASAPSPSLLLGTQPHSHPVLQFP